MQAQYSMCEWRARVCTDKAVPAGFDRHMEFFENIKYSVFSPEKCA